MTDPHDWMAGFEEPVRPRAPVPKGVGKFNVAKKEDRTLDGIVFDSKLEMGMYPELLKHFPAEYVQRQVDFVLQPGFRSDWNRKWQNPVVYCADFVLGGTVEIDGVLHPAPGAMVLDAKGMILPQFRTASRLYERSRRMPLYVVKTKKQLRERIAAHKKVLLMNKDLLNTLTSGKTLKVSGYCSADGKVADYVLRVVGREGYLSLVRHSLAALAEVVDEALKEGRDDIIEPAAAIRESLVKKLAEPENQAASYVSKETFEPVTPDILLLDGDPEKVVLMRVEVLSETTVKEAEKKTKSSAATLAKRAVESKLPIAAYRHRLNLYPGKFTSVEVVP